MKKMIAKDFNEFVEKANVGIRAALNSPAGQEITKQLLAAKLAKNPNMTAKEWNEEKSRFMTYIFCRFVQDCPEAMHELARHVYKELRTGKNA